MYENELERLWSDPGNWRGPFYHCPADPRAIVPKRDRRLGWTLNTAHPAALRTGVFLVVAASLPPVVSLAAGRTDPFSIAVAVAASVVIVCGISWYCASGR